jgi:hypothetical protein
VPIEETMSALKELVVAIYKSLDDFEEKLM